MHDSLYKFAACCNLLECKAFETHFSFCLISGFLIGVTYERDDNIGLKIKPNDKIMGICTSSGIIGHSLSFGRAHAVTVLSYDTLLADAVATALCNECKVKDQILIEESLKKFYIDGIIGAIVIFDDYLGFIGDIPELCETNIDFDLIAK